MSVPMEGHRHPARAGVAVLTITLGLLALLAFMGSSELAWDSVSESVAESVSGSEQGYQTPLHNAAGQGDVVDTEALIKAGADVDARDWLQRTPLHWAAVQGNVAVTKVLLDHGANMYAQDKSGKTPLDIARDLGHTHMLRLLMESNREQVAAATAVQPDRDGDELLGEGAQKPQKAKKKVIAKKAAKKKSTR